jgi:heat shock protein HtpX
MNVNGKKTGVVREKPLNRGAKFFLVLGAGAAVLSFYVFSLFTILFLAALIAAELALFIVLVRFAASRFMAPFMRRHSNVLGLFIKSFRIQKAVEFRIRLRQEDAPALHQLLGRLCERLRLNFPENVSLLMGDGAWVQLKGIRSGAGKTILGVGYDLLAGMSPAEMEAVLAHEMTHAKLIHRGFRNSLWAAQARIRKLAMALWAEINTARRAKQSSKLAHALYVVVDRLLRLCTRLMAAYSRQDEFDADRGAAELCGAGVMKSALAKLESLHGISSRLPWNERVAQLQQPSGYSQWLLQEITNSATGRAGQVTDVLFNKYSTHPSIPDRIAALPEDGRSFAGDSSSAIQFLADPDKIASKLLAELQRLMAEQEKKDSRALEKFSRKTGRQTGLQPALARGIFLIIIGLLFALAGAGSTSRNVIVPCGFAVIAWGVVAIFVKKSRDRLELPVPVYEDLIRPPAAVAPGENAVEREKIIQADLSSRVPGTLGAERALKLAEESYAALKGCNYYRAHVAARESLKFDKKSIEAALALAIATSAHRQIQNTAQLLAFVQKQTGFRTFSTVWGAAWAGLLAGDWIRAEAMLEKALKLEPQQTTLVALLALVQSRRGKLQSSIANARRACELHPKSSEMLKFLIARLLDAGFTREAQEQMRRMSLDMEKDPEVMLSMAQFHLLRHNPAEADNWIARLKASGEAPHRLLRAARYYENARLAEKAAALYQETLATGHYPEAHLGLGRVEAARKNKEDARKHILAALNVDRPVGKGGTATWQIFHPILAQMLGLQEPIAECQAWLCAFPAKSQPAALAGQSLIVYASDQRQAQEHLQTVINALQPEKPPMILHANCWRIAPRQMQPDGPVRPGVQGLWQ